MIELMLSQRKEKETRPRKGIRAVPLFCLRSRSIRSCSIRYCLECESCVWAPSFAGRPSTT